MTGTGARPKDLTGNRYGRLIAVKRLEMSPNAGYFWECSCDCGNTTKVTIGNLGSGHTLSCGCISVEVCKDKFKTHGLSKTKEYKCWIKMRERCLSVNDKEYPNYGAVGVTVQDSWIDSFENFINYMGMHPTDGQKYSIDRILNSKGYEEGNVRWATYFTQARNKGKMSHNTSGVNGVLWDNKTNGDWQNLYAKAVWKPLDDVQKSKCFSVKKYGLLPAFKLAVDYRNKMIAELNAQGAGYTELHGK